MPRIEALDPAAATGKVRELLDGVRQHLGTTPNMTLGMARSPAVLAGYVAFAGALAKGRLGARLREQIALVVAEANACDYCLSAHTAIGGGLGLGATEMRRNRHAEASDTRAAAALRFARRVVETRGGVDDADLEDVRAAGYDDGQIGEIVAEVALNAFTNYFNRVVQTEIDFPPVRAEKPVPSAA